jgi:hypothetical protein
MAMKKADLIKILVEEYGYEKEDIKLLTNGKLQAIIKQEEQDAKQLEEDEYAVVAVEAGFKDDDLIVVMNGLNGALTHRSGRNGRSWKFNSFGQQDKMPYAELKSLQNGSPKVFEQGWIVILNKKVQEEFGLTELYKNILTPDNIDEIFKKDVSELEVFIDNLPLGMKSTFVAKAREMYSNRTLYDIRIVELIENKFGFRLEDNAPISDIV